MAQEKRRLLPTELKKNFTEIGYTQHMLIYNELKGLSQNRSRSLLAG